MAVAYIWLQEKWKTPLDAALDYAGKGWKIFPCYLHVNPTTGNREKKPRVAWTEEATTDPAVIQRWWAKWPDALIGHQPGLSGHVVIDIDVKNGGKGEEQWQRLQPGDSDTMAASTLNKGRHLWFKKEPFDRVAFFKPDANIEVRSDGMYVILPSTPESGYRWKRMGEPKELPLWLVRRIAENEAAKKAGPRDIDTEVDYDMALKNMTAAMRKSKLTADQRMWLKAHVCEKKDILKDDEGDRSHILHRMECDLRDIGMTEGETFALVWRSGWCKFRFDRKNGDSQLIKEINKVYDGEESSSERGSGDDDEPPPPPQLLHEIDTAPNKFLWYPYLPEGEASIMAGPGGIGKGLAAVDIAARVTRGRRWPMSGGEKARAGNVLWMEEEDSLKKTVRVRMEAAGADLEKVIVADATQFKHYVNREYVKTRDIRLIVLSPLVSAMELENSISEIVVRRELKILAELFRDLPVSLLGLMHPNKKHDQAAVDRISGTTAFVNFPRSVVVIGQPKQEKKDKDGDTGDDDDEDLRDNRFRLSHQKHNLSVRGDDLIGERVARDLSDPRSQQLVIKWSRADANIAVDEALDRSKRDKKDGEGRQSAGDWLKDYLTVNGRMLKSTIMEDAAKRGYSEGSVEQARKRLGSKIKSEVQGMAGREQSFWTYLK